MNVLIVGSGGREHVLAWKIQQSSKVTKLYCAPGNAGIADVAECVPIKSNDVTALIHFAQEHAIDLTVIGPEAPLVAGIVDEFQKVGLHVFGPSQAAAQLEGSKVFSKEFMQRWHIPTAAFESFEESEKALDYVRKVNFPLVIKADGLASGKGVFICESFEEAEDAIHKIMSDKVFQDAGHEIVAEEFLEGEEASILAISDGKNFVVLEPSQDHKRVFDEDLGPNTGGMGAYSPVPVVTADVYKQAIDNVIAPAIHGMKEEGVPFRGVLYAGLMVTPDGVKVLEFNVRFGDPEAQVVLPRLQNDLVDVLMASCKGLLGDLEMQWDPRACVCVVMSSGGYPGSYLIGEPIEGLDKIQDKDTVVFHAGTTVENGKIVTSGGRVLGLTSLEDSIEEAIDKAYEAVEKIRFNHCFFRRDIGHKALKTGV